MATAAVMQRKGYDNVELSLSEDDDPVKEKKKLKTKEKKSSTESKESKSKESKETSKEEEAQDKKKLMTQKTQSLSEEVREKETKVKTEKSTKKVAEQSKKVKKEEPVVGPTGGSGDTGKTPSSDHIKSKLVPVAALPPCNTPVKADKQKTTGCCVIL
ncbi:unnamed protein product [Caenorhabditis brenneri]